MVPWHRELPSSVFIVLEYCSQFWKNPGIQESHPSNMSVIFFSLNSGGKYWVYSAYTHQCIWVKPQWKFWKTLYCHQNYILMLEEAFALLVFFYEYLSKKLLSPTVSIPTFWGGILFTWFNDGGMNSAWHSWKTFLFHCNFVLHLKQKQDTFYDYEFILVYLGLRN